MGHHRRVEYAVLAAQFQLEVEISAHGRVLTQNRRMLTGSGEICLLDGTVAVRVEGKFLKLPSAPSPVRNLICRAGDYLRTRSE